MALKYLEILVATLLSVSIEKLLNFYLSVSMLTG